jgi:hypothetical protein
LIFGKSDQILLGVPHQEPLPKWGRLNRALRQGFFVWPVLLIALLSLTLYLWSEATVTPTPSPGFSTKYLWLIPTAHFTFFPDFTPRILLPTLTKLEQLLERTAKKWSAHYMAHLIKDCGL